MEAQHDAARQLQVSYAMSVRATKRAGRSNSCGRLPQFESGGAAGIAPEGFFEVVTEAYLLSRVRG